MIFRVIICHMNLHSCLSWYDFLCWILVYFHLQKICVSLKSKTLSECTFFGNLYAASNLFKMLLKYRPEDKVAKKERLLKKAQAEAEGKPVESKKPIVVKYGLNHATYLIEQVVYQHVSNLAQFLLDLLSTLTDPPLHFSCRTRHNWWLLLMMWTL